MLIYQTSLSRKFFIPNEYIDSFEKLKENLPFITYNFYNLLIKHEISDKNYENVVNVWKTFEIKNLKDYHDLYLKSWCDVLLLADVLENFRNESINYFELDPAQYLCTPGYKLIYC